MMTNRGVHTYHEIFSQPDAWAAALDLVRGRASQLRKLFTKVEFDQIIYTGCGSSLNIALAAAATLQKIAGIPALGVPASEIWLYPRTTYVQTARTLLVAISRSGETTETLRAVDAFRANGGAAVLTLTAYSKSPLASAGDLNLILSMGQEKSVVSTRASSTFYLATVALAALWSDKHELIHELEELPPVCKRLMDDYGLLARDVAALPTLDRFYFLGSGPRYGLARDLALKMKEMSQSHSEAFHLFEFRHGPQAMITPTTLIVGLVSDAFHEEELQVLAEMRERGVRALSVGDQNVQVAFGSGLTEDACNVLCLPFGQLLAYHHAISKELDPDRPPNLTPVVKLP